MTEPTSKKQTSSDPSWTEADLRSSPHQHAQKAEKVRGMFAAIAGSYDLNNRVHSFGRDVAWRNAAVKLSGVTDSEEVLDVACGTGDLTRAFAARRPRRVVGLDFTPQMLDIACAKSGVARGLRSNEAHTAPRPNRSPSSPTLPEYLDGDAMNLPFADGSFDVVSIAFGLRNVSDPSKALREFRRVLRPRGRVVVLEFGRPRNRVIAWANDLYTAKIMPMTATIISRDKSGAYKYLPKSVETFLTREQLAEALKSAGFSGVKQTAMTFGVCVCSVGTC